MNIRWNGIRRTGNNPTNLPCLLGKWKILKYGKSVTEIWKPKYGNQSTETKYEEKPPISVQCLIDSWLCVLRPCSQRVTLPLQCESWILGSRTAVSVTVMMHVTAWPVSTKTNGEWGNHAGSMVLMFSWQWYRCKCCHNFSPRTSGSTSYKTTPKTEIDYTHGVMLNSAHWSPVYTYLALTSPRDNQPFGYKALNTDRCFSSHFCTSIFVLLFPYFSIFHLSLSVYQSSCADTNHAPCAFILIFFCSPLL